MNAANGRTTLRLPDTEGGARMPKRVCCTSKTKIAWHWCGAAVHAAIALTRYASMRGRREGAAHDDAHAPCAPVVAHSQNRTVLGVPAFLQRAHFHAPNHTRTCRIDPRVRCSATTHLPPRCITQRNKHLCFWQNLRTPGCHRVRRRTRQKNSPLPQLLARALSCVACAPHESLARLQTVRHA